MKIRGLQAVLLFISATILLVLVWKAVIPEKETFYHIPEAKLYVKRSGKAICFAESLGQLKSGGSFCDTDFRMRNKYKSTIHLPIERNRRVYVEDPHNSLVVLGSRRTIIWLSESETACKYPPSVAIEPPFSKDGTLHYRLPDGSYKQAVLVSKEEVRSAVENRNCLRFDDSPREILPSEKKPGRIENSDIHIEEVVSGVLSLHIRDNYVECVSPRGELFGHYPLFYYSPSYPNYLFCDVYVGSIASKRTKDINLVTSTPYAFLFNNNTTHKEDIKNWYCISLNPFSIEEVEWRWNN